MNEQPLDEIPGAIVALPHRGISEETCRKYGYVCANKGGKVVEIATYLRDGRPIGAKFRGPDKDFWTKGQMKDAPLWGQWLWAAGGKRLIICEGEIDCMSVSQVQDNKWPVVSVPNGAAGAAAAVRRELEYVSSFAEVILCFDMDEPGRKAALDTAALLPPGKVKIACLARKDANEMLQHGEGDALRQSVVWQSSEYRPDGIRHVSEIVTNDDISDIEIWEYPWWGLTEFAIGERPAEISLWTSGTGSGKSTIVRSLVTNHLKHGRHVGIVMLEESPSSTIDDIISDSIHRPVRRIRYQKALNKLRQRSGRPEVVLPADYTKDEYAEARRWIDSQKLYVYDHDGCRDDRSLESKIEYMAVGLGCRVVVLDHVTAAVAGRAGKDDRNDERLIIDKMMGELDSVVQRTGVHVHVICQLKKGTKAFEEGDRATLQDLRGSGALATVPHNIWFLQRNRQDPDKSVANTTMVWSLKCRFAGDRVGPAIALRFDPDRQSLVEVDYALNEDGDPIFGNPSTATSPSPETTSDLL